MVQRVLSSTLWISVKASILADLTQIITDFGCIEEVMAKRFVFVKKNRHQFAPTRFQRIIGIHVKHRYLGPEFGGQRRQSHFHIVAEMAVGA